jgi:uncharacterized protein YjiS (DUF1127 family)
MEAPSRQRILLLAARDDAQGTVRQRPLQRLRPSSRDHLKRTLTMAHAINLNAYADYDEQSGIFARLRQAFAAHREYLATYDELNALNDRDLADIGLSRLNVRDVARASVYGN